MVTEATEMSAGMNDMQPSLCTRRILQDKNTNTVVTPVKKLQADRAEVELQLRSPLQVSSTKRGRTAETVYKEMQMKKCSKKLRLRLALAMYKVKTSSEHLSFEQLGTPIKLPKHSMLNSKQGVSCQFAQRSRTNYDFNQNTLPSAGLRNVNDGPHDRPSHFQSHHTDVLSYRDSIQPDISTINNNFQIRAENENTFRESIFNNTALLLSETDYNSGLRAYIRRDYASRGVKTEQIPISTPNPKWKGATNLDDDEKIIQHPSHNLQNYNGLGISSSSQRPNR